MTQQVQKRNAQMVDLLQQDFQHRREPNYAWSRAVSMCLALPGLRAFWPMSAVWPVAGLQALDASTNVNHLANNNVALFGYDSLAPYVEFDGINQYLSRADGGAANWADVTGAEAYIVAAQRGLTLGGWFYFDGAAAALEVAIGKYDTAANQRSYALYRIAAGNARFAVSNNGIASVGVNGEILSGGQWYFLVGKFTPSTTISIYVNNTITSLAAGIPAALFDGTASFTVGAFANPASYMNGRASMCFLCAAQLSDAIILSVYEQTRAMYGV